MAMPLIDAVRAETAQVFPDGEPDRVFMAAVVWICGLIRTGDSAKLTQVLDEVEAFMRAGVWPP